MMYLVVVPIILMSIIIHEISHGYAALLLGDDTAKRYGRLSFNPLRHVDPFGTVVLPLLLLLSTGGRLVFGYAKPVPINPYNFNDLKRDTGLTALAGPLSNFVIALFFSALIRLLVALPFNRYTSSGSVIGFLVQIFMLTVFFNLLLGCFNLIPFPPLDGSKILGLILPDRYYYPFMRFERQGMMVFMGFILISYVFGWNLIGNLLFPPINFLLKLFTGL